MIGSRRWRSISFCTNGVGTDNRANPSVMTSGLTSFNHALCWGVRLGSEESPLIVSMGRVSPLSSATTLFQTATNGGSGSDGNDAHPLEADPETTEGTITNCPHSYPQVVDTGQPSSLCCLPAGTPRAGARHSGGADCGLSTELASSLRCLSPFRYRIGIGRS